ncbi:MAG: hypothetical protein ABIJ97_16380, partial [Bacteroidota bacterium]
YFSKSDYKTSETYYSKAVGIFSDKQYPKDKLAEIKTILDKIAAQENEKQLDEAVFKTEEEKVKFLSELAKKYPEGATVENYDLKGKKIKRIVVVADGIANDYREVTHDWGGVFYFKNGQNVSKQVFLVETKE